MKILALFVIACLMTHSLATCAADDTLQRSFLKKTDNRKEYTQQINFATTTSTAETVGQKVAQAMGNFTTSALALVADNSTLTNSTDPDEIVEDKVYSGNCFMKMHNWFYNIYPIAKDSKSNMILKSKDGKLLDFNLCHDIPTACTDKTGLIVHREQCTLYAERSTNDKIWNLTRSECPKGGNYTTIVELTCNTTQTGAAVISNEDDFDASSCTNTIKMTSQFACRTTQFRAWYKSFGVSKYVVGSILGVVGMFLLFFGNTYFKVCSSLIVAFASGIIIKSLIAPVVQITLPTSFIIGFIFAALLYSCLDLMVSVLSVIIGYFLGNISYNFVVKIFTGVDPDTLYLITIVSFIAITFIFQFLIKSIIIIVATSLIGAYCAVRGLSICLGGFPDETYTSRLILNREFNQLGKAFGGKANMYLMTICLLFVLGLTVQGSCGGGAEEKKKEEVKGEEHEKLNKADE